MEIAKTLLSKLPKNTLISIILVLGGLYFNKVLKEGKTWQDTVTEQLKKNQQAIIEVGTKNHSDHADIRFDINELKGKQDVILETIPEEAKRTAQRVHEIMEQMRKDKDKEKPTSYLLMQPIQPELMEPELNSEIVLAVDTIKKKTDCLDNF